MVDRAFLKPRTVDNPPYGDYQYLPIVRLYEADSSQGLEDLMNPAFEVEAQSVTEFYVVESIEYQVEVTKPKVGNNPAEMSYSALVWATQAIKL